MGINLNDEEVKEFAGIMRCSIQNWPISFLGLPLGGKHKSMAFWGQLVKRFPNRLAVGNEITYLCEVDTLIK